MLTQMLPWASSQGPRNIKFWIRLREGQVIQNLQYSCHYRRKALLYEADRDEMRAPPSVR